MIQQNPLIVDGSQGEGGGQILRTSLALAALLQKPIEIQAIRAKRKKPGLRPQHLMAVQALAKISNADTEGAYLNSTSLLFTPHTLQGGDYRFTIKTAGSAPLLVAAVLAPLLFAATPSQVIIEGGTHVPFSPPFHYLDYVLLPALQRMGVHLKVSLKRWGWYPQGGGRIVINITPCRRLTAVEWKTKGQLKTLELMVGLSDLPHHIAQRELLHAEKLLTQQGYPVDCHILEMPAAGPGNMVFLKGEFAETVTGFSALGRKGRPAEQVADEVCQAWFSFVESNAIVDYHLADQLVLFMALAEGTSSFVTEKMTKHLSTNIKIIEQFLPVHFDLDPAGNKVSVAGIGHTPLNSKAGL